MKRLVLTLAICLGCMGILGAQNVWKPIEMEGVFLGVSADGSIFSNCGYSGLHRSQDEGATWELNYDTYVSSSHFTINDNNRIFIFNQNSRKLCYSDDNGDTWQEQASGISTNWVEGMYSLSNDTIVMVNNEKFFWTLDGGESWNETSISFLQDMVFTSILADHAGNVYISITNAVPIYELGIYTTNFNDIDNWTWLTEGAFINHMELDPEGNVVAGGYGQYQQQPGLYLVPDWRFTVADNGIVYDLHNVGDDGYNYTVLRYSADHGETFYEYGEALPLYSPAPGGMDDGSIYKGLDGHLYFGGHGARKKSVFNTNDIHYIEGEVVIAQTSFIGSTYFNSWQAIRVDENHVYPVTVDGFRPDPTDLSRLIVRYDTIPVGAIIGAFGTITEMHDNAGHSENVLDIQQTTAHYYDAITAMLSTSEEDNKVVITLRNAPYTTYYLTINGEQQIWPLVFNGVTYEDYQLCTCIGHCAVMLNQYANQFNGMELVDIQPFRNCNFEMDGCRLYTNDWQPALTLPYENQHYLVAIGPGDYIIPYYPMHNGQLFKNTYVNNDIFREGTPVEVKGIEHIRYDIEGMEINTFELIEMDTEEETTLTGRVEWAPMPYTSYVPVPGLTIAFVANGKTYYLDNEHSYNGQTYDDDGFLVGNDTIYVGQEITATFTSKILIDNRLDFYYRINITEAEVLNEIFPLGSEWYYEILNENGSITYQYMYLAGDTIVQDEPTQILVKINTLYDKDLHEEVTHEYVYERDGKVYWWNKTLEEFTMLYDFRAEAGDEWEIKVGTESLMMHVDAVENIEFEGKTYRMLHVSDPDDLFSGDIVYGIGHLTSFFPERLMDNGDGVRVEGLRCYWVDDELVFKIGEEDCDAIYEELHGIEDGPSTPSTGSGTAGTLTVYPNPTNGVLFVETHGRASLSDQLYRITNLMGQTLMTGSITAETVQIDVSALPEGMYFFTFAGETRKFVVR